MGGGGGNIRVIERPVGVSLLRVSEWVNKLVLSKGKVFWEGAATQNR